MYRPSFAPVSPLRAGEVLAGKYRIEALLGEGGMGAVYRATRLSDGDFVAVKVMRSEHASDASMAERFRREAEVVRGIDSARISAVYDFDQTPDGTLYLAMELLRGMSLTAHLESEVLIHWPEAVRIAREVALGLAAVHGAGVIHRDLKPDNIYVCDGGAIKILDFGIAKEYGNDWAKGQVKGKPLTQAGVVVGTPLYMSPEAVTQSPMGPPTDLYALGAVLFEMLTGRLLFEEPEPVLLMGHQLRTRPDRVRDVGGDPDIPPALDALVDQLLAKDPKKRPPSAQAVADALAQIAAMAPPPSIAARASAPSGKPRRPAALVPTQLTTKPEDQTTARRARLSAPEPDADPDGERPWGEERTNIDPIVIPPGSPGARSLPTEITPSPAMVAGASRTSPASRMPWVVAGAIACVGLTLGGWAVFGAAPAAVTPSPLPTVRPDVTPPTTTSADPVPTDLPLVVEPAALAPPSLAAIRFEIVPADARVSEGGVAVADGIAQLPRDGAEHTFVVEARGRVTQRVRVTADDDQTIRVTLRRSGGAPPTDIAPGGDIAREF